MTNACLVDNPFYFYNSPCSTGPGQKNYTFTIWALKGSLYDELAALHGRTYLTDEDIIDNTTTKATQLLDLANEKDLIIANATLHAYYTRYKVYLVPSPSGVPTHSPTKFPVASPTQRPHQSKPSASQFVRYNN